MTYIKPRLQPGIVRDNTELASEGGWTDADKVRFRIIQGQGLPEEIGGWQKVSPEAFEGKARQIRRWNDLEGRELTAIGTSQRVYIVDNALYWDVTPVRIEGTLTDPVNATGTTWEITHTAHGLKTGDTVYLYNDMPVGGGLVGKSDSLLPDPLRTINGATRVSVSWPGHPLQNGDWITLAGATDVGGVPAVELNIDHKARSVTADSIQINVDTNATATVSGGGAAVVLTWYEGFKVTVIDENTYSIPKTSGVGTGGGTLTYKYNINIGLDQSVAPSGYSTGTYSSGPYSVSEVDPELLARVWTFDNFGEDLTANYARSPIYRWQGNLSQPLEPIPATDAPANVLTHLVTPERFLVALGTQRAADDVFDALNVRWATQEGGYADGDWTPTAENTAGDFRLANGSRIVRGIAMPLVFLVWTERGLTQVQYLGDTEFIFRPNQIGTECGIGGVNSVARVGDSGQVFWVGSSRNFYTWAGGAPRVVPCPLLDDLADEFQDGQEALIYAGVNARYNEVWWFYPSRGNLDNTDYIIYNYLENHWSIGTFKIGCWADRGPGRYPLAVHHDTNLLYFHDFGNSADGGKIASFAESAYFDIGDGDAIMHIKKVIPDFEDLIGGVNIELTGRYYPEAPEFTVDFGTAINARAQLDARITARQIKMRLSSDTDPSSWRMGALSFDVIETGSRR